jgi:hypothetical protein
MEIEIDEPEKITENIKEYMDEPYGYYLYVNLKSDNKYHLLHIYDNEVNFILEYGFSITNPDSTVFIPIKIENIVNILKTFCDYNDINLIKPVFKESDSNIEIRIRIRTFKRKLENPSFPPKKRKCKTDGKRKSRSRLRRKSRKKKKIKSRSKF